MTASVQDSTWKELSTPTAWRYSMSGGMGAEEICSAIEESARVVEAPFSRDKVWPILSAFEGGFSDAGGVIFSLQAGAQVAGIPADEWTGYLPVGNHPECPSGLPAGSTQKEPGTVPATDLGDLAHAFVQRHISANVMD
ncbi:hypothetical protein [Streptomyces sp. NPDC002671]